MVLLSSTVPSFSIGSISWAQIFYKFHGTTKNGLVSGCQIQEYKSKTHGRNKAPWRAHLSVVKP